MAVARSGRTLVQAIGALRDVPDRGFTFLQEGEGGELVESYVSFLELEARIRGRAATLQAAGIGRGERLPIILEDTQEFITAFLGTVLAGAIPVSVYPPAGVVQLRRYGQTIAAIVDRSDAGAILVSAKLADGLRRAEVLPARRVLAVEALGECRGGFAPAGAGNDDVAFLQFTSGSTSAPKGVTVTHANLAHNTAAIGAGFRLTPQDLMVSWLPMHHDMGLIGFMLTPLFHAVSCKYLPTQTFLRRPGSWLRAISHSPRPVVSVAPNFAFARVARRMKDQDVAKLDLSAWRAAGCGAEPVVPADLELFASRLAPAGFDARALQPMYGLAEATLAVTFSPLGQGMRSLSLDAAALRGEGTAVEREGPGSVRIASCGKPLPGWELATFAPEDEDGARPLEEGQVGEIRLRGPCVMAGYWRDEAATRAAMAGGWLKTGDLGFLRGGELFICGRAKELMIFHGRNYFPDDVERAVLGVSGLRLAMAFQPHAARGAGEADARLVVAVEAAAPERVDAAAIQRAVSTEVGLVVDEIVFAPLGSLPKTTSGKLQRRQACRLYEAGTLGSG